VKDRAKDMTGLVFERLTVLGRERNDKDGSAMWKCQCSCGNIIITLGANLRAGRSKSCGCLQKDVTSARCKGKRSMAWKGGRGFGPYGYIEVYKPDHPFAKQTGRVSEHRLVMEKMVGRYLNPNEIVHHCNGDRADNRPYNLMLFDSKNAHVAYHHRKLGGLV